LLSHEAKRTTRANKRVSHHDEQLYHQGDHQDTAVASINKHKSVTHSYKSVVIQDMKNKTDERSSYSSSNSSEPMIVHVRGLIEGGLLSVAQAGKKRAVTAYSGQIQVTRGFTTLPCKALMNSVYIFTIKAIEVGVLVVQVCTHLGIC
jgi:hypothetical protein